MKQRGVTLIELTLALAVIAAILLAVTRIYYMVDNSHKVNSATNMVLNVYQAAAHYNQSFTSDQNLMKDFIDRGYLPSDYQNATINPWGGKIAALSVNTHSFRVLLTLVPVKLCKNLQDKFKNVQNAKADCLIADVGSNTFTVTFDMDLPRT